MNNIGNVLLLCTYTTGSPKLVRTAQTVSNLSTVAVLSSLFPFISGTGSWDSKMVYLFFITPITRSTWMRIHDICHGSSTSRLDNYCLPFVKAGIKRRAPWMAKSSSTRKPRSARTISPESIRFKKLQFLVSTWSVQILYLPSTLIKSKWLLLG